MKNTISSIIFCLLFSNITTAQSAMLYGKIKNQDDTIIKLILLEGDGHYSEPSIRLNIDANGNFGKEIKTQRPLFALLRSNDYEHRIFLTPGSSLSVVLDTSDLITEITGTAAGENLLIQKLGLDEIAFYNQSSDPATNQYAKQSLDSLISGVLDVCKNQIAEREQIIRSSQLTPGLKSVLTNEVRYSAQINLLDFGANTLRWAKNPAEKDFVQLVIKLYPVPSEEIVANGFYPNMMLNRFIQHDIQNVDKNELKDPKGKEKLSQRFFGIPFDTLSQLSNRYGEKYIFPWLYAKKKLSTAFQQQVLLDKILNAYNDGSLKTVLYLFDTLNYYFPAGKWNGIAKERVDLVKNTLATQSQNKKIIIKEVTKDTSFNTLLNTYKGKLVYVDIWGTWCGPCKTEMKYVARLKKKFEGKDIVFVYLDMDESEKHEDWKEYIRFYGIEGEHFRFDSKEIESFWREVKAAGGTTNLYPTYLIFDRAGKLINAGAERPSSEDKLYTQLGQQL